MRHFKKFFLLFTTIICFMCLLCACSSNSNQNSLDNPSSNSDVKDTEPTTNASLEKALELERPYYDDIEYAIETLKNREKYPNSFKINDIFLYITKKGTPKTYILVNYSAKDSSGNTFSTTVACGANSTTISNDNGLYNTSKEIVNGQNSSYTELEEGYYESDRAHVFKLNKDDYLNKGYYLP